MFTAMETEAAGKPSHILVYPNPIFIRSPGGIVFFVKDTTWGILREVVAGLRELMVQRRESHALYFEIFHGSIPAGSGSVL